MTEKTTPELPFTLAEQTFKNVADGTLIGRNVFTLQKSVMSGGLMVAVSRYEPTDDEEAYDGDYPGEEHIRGYNVDVDPAELMRNLAAFVPEVEPVAWLDSDGDFFVKDSQRFDGSDPRQVWTRGAAWTDADAPTPLYAHPPVPAEPATAPSVDLGPIEEDERISAWELIADHPALRSCRDEERPLIDSITDKITALAATAPSVEQIAEVPEFQHDEQCEAEQERDTGAWTMCGCWASRAEATGLREALAREESRVKELKAALTEMAPARDGGNGVSWEDRAGKNEALWQEARAEVERCKAALEAAEWLMRTTSKHVEAQRDLIAANRGMETTGAERFEAQKAYKAARAAVEAETSEEAGA